MEVINLSLQVSFFSDIWLLKLSISPDYITFSRVRFLLPVLQVLKKYTHNTMKTIIFNILWCIIMLNLLVNLLVKCVGKTIYTYAYFL